MKAQTNAFVRSRAPSLRSNPTDVERKLWYRLRQRNLGARFRRQHPWEDFILDFVCLEHRLVVEVDGSQHFDQQQRDDARTRRLAMAGFRVLRFWDNEVLQHLDDVLESIHRALHSSDQTHPLPGPPLEGEGNKP